MMGSAGRGRTIAVVILVAAVASACGARDWRRALLKAGAINVGEAVEQAMQDSVSVMEASFSPDSSAILVHVLSLTEGTGSLWIYSIGDGTLVENGLRPGWTLESAAFMADSEHLLLATERPEPPTFRLYQTRVGSTEWANLTDMIPTSHVKVHHVAPSPDGETFAVLSSGESHPDVMVSRAGEVLAETQVYPGFVSIVGWNREGDVLFLESDMPLDLGLTMEQREKNIGWDESMRDGGKTRIFALSVTTGAVSVADAAQVPNPTISPDGKWKLHVIPVGEAITGLFLTAR